MSGWRLSGFGDEIDPEPCVQLAVLAAVGARLIDVRSAWDVNIVELDADRLAELAGLVRDAGMAVSAVSSPVGKVDIDTPVEDEVERLERAVAAAHALGAPFVRVFSFQYGHRDPESVRDEVLRRLAALVEVARRGDVVLLLENESGLYGDQPERVLDVVESVGSERLRVAWDGGNFVRVGRRPFDEAFPLLVAHIAYLHVKDALADGASVPAGAGDAQLPETIAALTTSGFDGVAALEPHLAVAGRLGASPGRRDSAWRPARSRL
ncbi:hypothetical protein GCM10025881_09090 [Pseudolysinimonas kribbensis]|uniref:Xylose isomerase-like TIM barrel domain-containing protein n=1 Tax=Pseudolysinimonas kribbensis TaxID=433641 RepID=A0ABQ6K3D3_9MICO|nr:hypothetical protein GCM10025881_09090 [Pseudolysinimonas kribbensis]